MEKKTTYHEQPSIDNTVQLREVLATLPDFCDAIISVLWNQPQQAKTRISYVYDIRLFLSFFMYTKSLFQ